MLRLKQIDLFGFKSFCNRERLRFAGRGFAAVVGPNGCGKSNICDAVNWVLGEQSAKSLRGSRMHDVIFSGTSKRPAAGMATVTLTLQGADGTLERLYRNGNRPRSAKVPAGKRADEIAVTRKLFRNGNSQYILNGKVVRLRDVRDLFLGTGLGPNHYAIIEQGRIGQLLSSRPLDRRAFVEEAAGVTRFKARRKLAEIKLANASLNLERVHDILEEVRRQANSLKRQADRAERHERHQEELRSALRLVFAGRFRRLEGERTSLQAEVTAKREDLRKGTEETERLESEFAAKRDRERAWEEQREEAREALSGLRISAERMRERIEQQSRAVESNAERTERARLDLEAASQRVQGMEESAEAERGKVESLRATTEELRKRLHSKGLECDARKASVSSAIKLQEASRSRLLKKLNQIFEERARLGKLDQALAGHAGQIDRARSRRDEAVSRLSRIETESEQLRTQSEKLRARVQDAARRCEALREDAAACAGGLEALRESAAEQAADVSRLDARRDSVQEMLDHREYSTDSVKEIFDARHKSRRLGFRPLGVLADFLDVDVGFEKPVEQLLGEDLEYIVVDGWDQAGRGVGLVRDEVGGRAAFLVRMRVEGSLARTLVGEGRAVSLADRVRIDAPASVAAPALPPKLRNGFLVDTSAAAERLAGVHPELYFLLPDGTWYHGNTVQAGRKESCGPLVLKQQLRELGPQLEEAERKLATLEHDTRNSSLALRRKVADLEAARERLQTLDKEAQAVEQSVRQNARISEDLERARTQALEDIDRLEGERSHSERLRRGTLANLERLDAEYADLEARVEELAARVLEGRRVLSRVEEERAALRAESAALAERLRAGNASLRRAEALLADRRRLIADSERQVKRWREESAELVVDNEHLRRRITNSEGQQERLQQRIRETAGQLDSSRAWTTELIEAVREQRGLAETARQECSTKEIALARVQSDLDHAVRDCESELGEAIASVAAQAPDDVSADEQQEAERRHLAIRKKIERLGPVNVLARDEYREVSLRRDFLETQEKDLLDAIANTRQAIAEIDSTSRERFDAAFRAINANFRDVFATLFEGGVGEMRLTDPGNQAESGIEIVAQPPGKRLQNVALLSGGEKSLTVMALLMATFRYKPSPFCVLDEVDSQLDEANTVRLRRLLQQMAPETQFILITHSKTMMEIAETLYGVTMGEAGVSKMVSVQMAERRAEAGLPGSVELQPVAVGL